MKRDKRVINCLSKHLLLLHVTKRCKNFEGTLLKTTMSGKTAFNPTGPPSTEFAAIVPLLLAFSQTVAINLFVAQSSPKCAWKFLQLMQQKVCVWPQFCQGKKYTAGDSEVNIGNTNSWPRHLIYTAWAVWSNLINGLCLCWPWNLEDGRGGATGPHFCMIRVYTSMEKKNKKQQHSI